MKAVKTFTIEKNSKGKSSFFSGTIDELVNTFSYTLLCGKSYQHEKGNKKINTQPKNIKSLVTNLNNAVDNSASDGCSNVSYTIVDANDIQK